MIRKEVLLAALLALILFVAAFAQSVDEWRHDTDIVYVRPVGQGSGVVRDVEGEKGAGIMIQIIRGQVSFGVEAFLMNGQGSDIPYSFPSQMRYQFVLHAPDNNGNDIATFISSVLTGPNTITWNSNTVPDGVYAITFRLYSAGLSSGTVISRFRTRSLFVIVDNDNAPITGSQWLPSTGYKTWRSRNYDGTGIDWIWYPGWSLPSVHQYPYTVFDPPQTPQERQQLRDDNAWFTETLWAFPNARGDEQPAFQRTNEGHVTIVGTKFYVANDKKSDAVHTFLADGERNQGGIMGPTTLVANARGRGVVGATYADRVVFAGPDGIATIAGYVTKQDALPCIMKDCSESNLFNQKELIGNFQNNELFAFSKQSELIFDTNDDNKIYISDTYNHRIALLEVNGCDDNYQNCNSGYPRITTFAGQYGSSGYQNGQLLSARFNTPQGMAIVGRTLYVADTGNDAIRAIDLDNGTVSTVFNQGLFSQPYVVRRDSQGDLFVKAGKPIYHLDLQSGNVNYVTEGGKEDRMGMDVDWRGNFGPIDDVLFPGETSDHYVGRVSADGSNRIRLIADGGFPFYYNDAMGGDQGSYVLQVAIDDEEARVYFTHTYRERPTVIRPLQSNDPIDIDRDIAQRGLYILHHGTIWEFNPHWQRPSLATIHGPNGHHWLGNTIPTFDDLALMSDLQLAEYIKNGMAGNIERPEITGKDLQGLIYFIRVLSVQGKFQEYDPDDIRQNLAGTEFWPDVNDQSSPTISNVTVTDLGGGMAQVDWTTNEQTIGVITYGTTRAIIDYRGLKQEDYYGLFSQIENSYSQQHSLIIENLPSNQQMKFKIIARDKAGNVGKSAEMTLTAGSGGQGPSTPQGLIIRP